MAPISAVAPSFLNDFLPKFGIEKKDSLKESDGPTTHPVSHWANCDLEP